MITKNIYNKLAEYTSKEITLDKKLFKDLKIYGDDLEEFIQELSQELDFDEIEFWKSFENLGYYNPGEIYLNLPKFFYLDLKALFFNFKIKCRDPKDTGKDISVKELCELIEGQIGSQASKKDLIHYIKYNKSKMGI